MSNPFQENWRGRSDPDWLQAVIAACDQREVGNVSFPTLPDQDVHCCCSEMVCTTVSLRTPSSPINCRDSVRRLDPGICSVYTGWWARSLCLSLVKG
jgi:hypothetical protein